MTRKEMLLLQLMEEASEVSQAIAKVLRFGPNNRYPTQADEPASNRVVTELIDFAVLLDMCLEENIIPDDVLCRDDTKVLELMRAKREKVEKYLEALGRLDEMRRRLEGALLFQDLDSCLARLGELHHEIGLRAGDLPSCYRDAITKRVAELTADLPVDEVRIAQEVAIAAQRMDISEELARLKSHLEQCRSLISSGGVVGRRLDFLVQELHRETNTISAKAADLGIVRAAVDMKTEIERLREQVQNNE